MIKLNLNQFSISNSLPFILIAGPCVLENEKKTLIIAEEINKICSDLDINYVFKSSFDKANRSS
ncbi:3-deoxy-8-phosphooctulonate synthase, partial [Pelagibacteraceae bacterium]|nr:3-deoxy-8-phosphooctulonate synthase [Pelagibacteraceae bacterium]